MIVACAGKGRAGVYGRWEMIRVRTKRASAPLAVAILAFVAALACAAPAAAAPCKYTPGADGLIIEAAVLRTQGVMRNGQVLIGADGKIACVAKRCAGAGAALLKCPHLVLSPGMINTHDHLAFTGVAPIAHPGELYAHRHEWRKGLNGHKSIEPPSAKPGDVDVLAWGRTPLPRRRHDINHRRRHGARPTAQSRFQGRPRTSANRARALPHISPRRRRRHYADGQLRLRPNTNHAR
ncbi:MAG: hypothetical protein WDN76_10185 [Alphaproteobacteria bacterium]